MDKLLHPYYVIRFHVRYHWTGLKSERHIKPGDIYEDCSYHPMVCIENNRGDLTGVSMIDGRVGCCSYFHCGVVKLTKTQAYKIKKEWVPGKDKVDWDALAQE